ncbi:ParB family protein [Rhizorhabdus wittichii RW1]|uniref:ParB family protein n=1 Tax=Rhizorhabdus wittichii (strain DSM 6014 / CCUG 31198 / JCM 15750 / NBRC 105917 / EY 4224 / RW1) TaxID=392499 RepID=A0A9J9H7Y2_RHIWR|nr:ParB family protein [Rhizorhabdus wittichii RW1]
MTKHVKIALNGSIDIPFSQLVLSQANVRRVKAGVSIDALAADIARRGLLQSLTVRARRDEEGSETGLYEVPAGGRRFRALQLLVKQRKMTKAQPVPCILRDDDEISAEEDSLAENTHREALHPLDQFRAMQHLVGQGTDIETVAATFMVTPAVVKQRLRLASVSPKLLDIYAEDGMTLDQLTAFSVTEDHARQEQVWEMVEGTYNAEPYYIRRKLTENTVHASDRRVRFVGLDAYTEAGGHVLRDLFDDDSGGWLEDVALLDRLVDEKLQAEGARIGEEGWKWVAVAIDFPWNASQGLREIDGEQPALSEEDEARLVAFQQEADALEAEWAQSSDIPDEVDARITEVDEEIAGIVERPLVYDPEEVARAGVFVSLDRNGSLYIERGFVRPEDEPPSEPDADVEVGENRMVEDEQQGAIVSVGGAPDTAADEETVDEAEDQLRPLPDRLVSELTAWRTIALQDAFARSPNVAFAAVLHAMALSVFYHASRESCLQLSLTKAIFSQSAPGTRTAPPTQAIAERHNAWKARLPEDDAELWDALRKLCADEQADLFAHCAAYAVNAQWERVSPYDGRMSPATIERRIAHSHVLAHAVGLDMTASWQPTVASYLGQVTKARILEAVSEAKDPATASRIEKLGKADMAREAEQLLAGTGWLPEPMRTPEPTASDVEPSTANDGEPAIDTIEPTSEDSADADEMLPVAAE